MTIFYYFINLLLFQLFYISFIIIDNFVGLVTKNIYLFYKNNLYLNDIM